MRQGKAEHVVCFLFRVRTIFGARGGNKWPTMCVYLLSSSFAHSVSLLPSFLDDRISLSCLLFCPSLLFFPSFLPYVPGQFLSVDKLREGRKEGEGNATLELSSGKQSKQPTDDSCRGDFDFGVQVYREMRV